MKFRYLILFLSLGLNTGWADFSNASVELHPFYPLDGPFIIDIKGDWPSDCHPGEQRPVIRAYDGNSVLIEFDIIVVHVTCTEVPTPYRVLVDMSEVVGTVAGNFTTLDILVRFDDVELNETVILDCTPVIFCPESPAVEVRPENGLFNNTQLANQGLILERQDQALAAYPLVYSETGDSEWLFAGGRIDQDVYFEDLYELTGGQCPGCPLPVLPPVLNKVGTLTLLMDSPGIVQVKINDGLFREYQSLVYGYRTFAVGPAGEQTLVDIEGRWGIAENRGTNPPLGDLTGFLPGAFDIVLEDIVTANGPLVPDGQVTYLVSTPTGETLGQLVCAGQTDPETDANVCEFIDPTDQAEPLFLFFQDSPSSLSIEYGRPVIAVGTPPGGKALRLE